MDLEELYKYAYVKKPLNQIYPSPSDVPAEFLLEWFKDTFDYQRTYSDEEVPEFMSFEPEDILEWLEETLQLTWESKKIFILKS